MKVVKFIALVLANVLTYVFVVAAVGLLALKMAFNPMTVLTPSMEPSIKPGDAVYVSKTVKQEELKAGDVITFQSEAGKRTYITHRIITIMRDETGFPTSITTKGDNNSQADEAIVPEQVMGVVKFHLPKMGYVSDFAQKNIIADVLFVTAYVLLVIGLGTLARLGEKKGGAKRRGDGNTDTTMMTIKDGMILTDENGHRLRVVFTPVSDDEVTGQASPKTLTDTTDQNSHQDPTFDSILEAPDAKSGLDESSSAEADSPGLDNKADASCDTFDSVSDSGAGSGADTLEEDGSDAVASDTEGDAKDDFMDKDEESRHEESAPSPASNKRRKRVRVPQRWMKPSAIQDK